MKRITTALVVLALLAISVAGCAPSTSTTPGTPGTGTPGTSTSTATAPGTEPSVSPTDTTPTQEAVSLNVYFTYKEKMQAVQRYAPAGTKGVLKAAIEALLAGPTADEKAAGLSSQVPQGTTLNSVRIDGDVAVVDLSSTYGSGGGSLSMLLRVAEVVYTATQFKTVGSVRFVMDGTPVDALGGEGVVLSKPQSRADWEDQAPAILVESPAWGGTVREGSMIRGTANVFEAVLNVLLKDASGLKLFETTVNASSGTGTRGAWSTKAALGGSLDKKGTLRVFSLSPKDGKAINVIDIPVVLEQ